MNREMTPEVYGKIFVGVEDSVVRGTNSSFTVELAKEAGFEMNALMVYTPMVGGRELGVDLGCIHGVDMPPEDNFITSRVGRDPKAIANELGIDYVGFLSVQGLVNVFERFGINGDELCLECIYSRN